MTNTIFISAHAATFVAYACFAALLAVRAQRTWLMGLVIAAVLVTAIWTLARIAVALGYTPDWSDPLANAARDAAWLGVSFGLMFPRLGHTLLWRGLVALAVLLTALQIGLDLGLISPGGLAGVRIDGALLRVATTVLSLVLLENIFRNSSGTEFWSLKHLVIGLLCICIFQLASRVPEFLTHETDPNMAIARPLVFLLALPLFAVSSIRLPNLLLRVHSSRSFVFHTATLIAAGIMLQGVAVAAWYVRTYGGSNGTVLAVILLFAGAVAIAVALASGTLRSRIRQFTNENFFNLKYDYRLEWEKVIRSLSLNPEQGSAERVLHALCDLLDSPGGAIWVHRPSWRQFLPAAKFGFTSDFVPIPEADSRLEPFGDEDRAFIAIADTAKDVSAAALWRRDFASSWIVVPLRYRSTIVGLIMLVPPRAPRKLDWEDENLIRLVGLQLGAHLVQEETAQSLADARQLEEFNKRFAFVVHDIKNTIGQLSLLVRNAVQFGHKQEFRDDMVVTLGNAVERLQELLRSLTTVGTENVPGSRPKQAIDLIAFLTEFTKEKGNSGQGVILDANYASLGLELTDIANLRRVLEHVVTNAVEASGEDKTVKISVSPAADAVEIVVTDQGPGMTEKFINEELFRPMRTTKAGGFGIGAYQARQLMRDLGGDIFVTSKLGVGTSVTLSLPKSSSHGSGTT